MGTNEGAEKIIKLRWILQRTDELHKLTKEGI